MQVVKQSEYERTLTTKEHKWLIASNSKNFSRKPWWFSVEKGHVCIIQQPAKQLALEIRIFQLQKLINWFLYNSSNWKELLNKF